MWNTHRIGVDSFLFDVHNYRELHLWTNPALVFCYRIRCDRLCVCRQKRGGLWPLPPPRYQMLASRGSNQLERSMPWVAAGHMVRLSVLDKCCTDHLPVDWSLVTHNNILVPFFSSEGPFWLFSFYCLIKFTYDHGGHHSSYCVVLIQYSLTCIAGAQAQSFPAAAIMYL